MLAQKLFDLGSFKRQFSAVLHLSVGQTIPNLNNSIDRKALLDAIDWNNMLGIASVLACSDQRNHLESALRIVQTALCEPSTNVIQRDAAAVILNSLTNIPAINLAINRGLLSKNYEADLPFSIKMQNIKNKFENSIYIGNDLISLNRFQKKVHEKHLENEAISISSPTSAGKSFILCNILINHILEGKKLIVYMVPTRALISQVESDVAKLMVKHKLDHVNLSTVPQKRDDFLEANIFIFTQERLHWFLIENEGVAIDVLFVDEAQKIEDGYRGILLQQKIEEVVSKNPSIKIYFSSPFTENPEILLENFGDTRKSSSVNTQFVSVNQNLIFVSQLPRISDIWTVSLCSDAGLTDLGQIQLSDRPTTEGKKIVFLLNAISGGSGGNIIYCNGAADAEKLAILLGASMTEMDTSKEIEELIALVRKTIHKDYGLVNSLKKRIAFHYGNMPLLIRQEIERLFANGDIKHLLCTSTLLEGVNLPARSIYIRKPTRGVGKPLNQNDFWNLAGRAGRWGKEFSGNIICIGVQQWKIAPEINKAKQKIVRAVDLIEADGEALIDYIENGSVKIDAEKNQNLEFAFGYYYNRFLIGSLAKQNSFHNKLSAVLEKVKAEIALPDYIIKRNPGISPIAQQNLLNYFRQKDESDIPGLVPVYPEDENAFEEYTKLIGRIGKTIAKYPHQLNSHRAVILINWMSGKSLAEIIKSSQKSWAKKNPEKKLATIIRDVMNEVENFARFNFAKDSSCYIDVLRYFLKSINRTDLLEKIPQLNLWLEFGVSQKTHLSLLSLGLSRSTVVELSEHIINSDLSVRECLDWFRETNLDIFDLSPIMLEDIKTKVLLKILN